MNGKNIEISKKIKEDLLKFYELKKRYNFSFSLVIFASEKKDLNNGILKELRNTDFIYNYHIENKIFLFVCVLPFTENKDVYSLINRIEYKNGDIHHYVFNDKEDISSGITELLYSFKNLL